MITHTVSVPVDHPSFSGHFPGQPILPGVVLLDYALQTIKRESQAALQRCELLSVKFLQPVPPGAVLQIELESAPSGAVKFTIRLAEHMAALVAIGSVKPA